MTNKSLEIKIPPVALREVKEFKVCLFWDDDFECLWKHTCSERRLSPNLTIDPDILSWFGLKNDFMALPMIDLKLRVSSMEKLLGKRNQWLVGVCHDGIQVQIAIADVDVADCRQLETQYATDGTGIEDETDERLGIEFLPIHLAPVANGFHM